MSDNDLSAATALTLAAIINEPQFRDRVVQLTRQLQEIEQATARLQAERAKGEELHRQVTGLRNEVEALHGSLSEREAKHRDNEANLSRVVDGINAEKAAWEEVRQRVDAEQKREAARLSTLADALDGERRRLDGDHMRYMKLLGDVENKAADLDHKLEMIGELHGKLGG